MYIVHGIHFTVERRFCTHVVSVLGQHILLNTMRLARTSPHHQHIYCQVLNRLCTLYTELGKPTTLKVHTAIKSTEYVVL